MITLEDKKMQEEKWLKEHVLTPEQFKQLIKEKTNRATFYRLAIAKREAFFKSR